MAIPCPPFSVARQLLSEQGNLETNEGVKMSVITIAISKTWMHLTNQLQDSWPRPLHQTTDLLFVIMLVAGQAFRFFVQSEQVSICFVDGNRFDFELGVFQFDGSEDDGLPFTKLDFIKACVVFLHLLWRRQFSIDVNFRTRNIGLHQTGRACEAFDGDKLSHPRLSFCTH